MFALALGAVGCGGGDPFAGLENETDFGPPVTGSSEQLSARLDIEQTAQLRNVTAGSFQGEDTLQGVLSTFEPNTGSLPEGNTARYRQMQLEYLRLALGNGKVANPHADEFVTCTNSADSGGGVTTLTLSCDYANESGNASVRGTVAVSSSSLSIDVSVGVDGSEDGLTISSDGEYALEATFGTGFVIADGSVSTSVRLSNAQFSANVSGQGRTITDISIDQSSCISGSRRMGLKMNASASGGGQSQSGSVNARSLAGVACPDHDVTLNAFVQTSGALSSI